MIASTCFLLSVSYFPDFAEIFLVSIKTQRSLIWSKGTVKCLVFRTKRVHQGECKSLREKDLGNVENCGKERRKMFLACLLLHPPSYTDRPAFLPVWYSESYLPVTSLTQTADFLTWNDCLVIRLRLPAFYSKNAFFLPPRPTSLNFPCCDTLSL